MAPGSGYRRPTHKGLLLGAQWECGSDDRDVDTGCGVGRELFAVLGGLWFGETRSRKRVLRQKERFITTGRGPRRVLLFIHLVETNSLSDSVKCPKKKKVGEVCGLGVGVIDIILYRMAGKASLRK